MTPAEVLCTELAACRRRGDEFADAWTMSLPVAVGAARGREERRQWRTVFAGVIDAWRSAYERRDDDDCPSFKLRELRLGGIDLLSRDIDVDDAG